MCGIEEGALEYLHTGPPQPCYATGQYNCRRLRVFSRGCQVRVEPVECEHWQYTTRFVFMKSIGNVTQLRPISASFSSRCFRFASCDSHVGYIRRGFLPEINYKRINKRIDERMTE